MKSKNVNFFSSKYSKVLWLAFMLAFFNQWSGINFVLYYAPEILQKIFGGGINEITDGLSEAEKAARAAMIEKQSLFNSIAIGGTNLIFTFVGLYLLDRLGRKTLMIIGSLGYIISLAAVGFCFYSGANPSLFLAFIMMFIASHAIGQGAVIWVFISEIFPNNVRAFGQAWGSGTHWVFAAIITLITPLFLDSTEGIFKDNPYPIFLFFAAMMVFQLIWVLTKMPETKGVSLEDLEKRLVGK
jgi:MFS family permease